MSLILTIPLNGSSLTLERLSMMFPMFVLVMSQDAVKVYKCVR